MVIKILGNCESVAFKAAEMFVKAKGHTLWCDGYRCDLAIAPLLTVKVSDEELKEGELGYVDIPSLSTTLRARGIIYQMGV